jgi:hypothetical protein
MRSTVSPIKAPWTGRLTSFQPRIRLDRSFDQRDYSYLGHVLAVDGVLGGEPAEVGVAFGQAAQREPP